MTVISWNTTKTETGYRWMVYSIGYQIPMTVLKEGVVSTRAKAVNRAHTWTRYLKAVAQKAA